MIATEDIAIDANADVAIAIAIYESECVMNGK